MTCSAVWHSFVYATHSFFFHSHCLLILEQTAADVSSAPASYNDGGPLHGDTSAAPVASVVTGLRDRHEGGEGKHEDGCDDFERHDD